MQKTARKLGEYRKLSTHHPVSVGPGVSAIAEEEPIPESPERGDRDSPVDNLEAQKYQADLAGNGRLPM